VLVRSGAVAALVAGLALLAACGGSSGDGRATASSSTSSSSTTTTAPPATGRATQWRDDTARWRQLVPGALAMGRAAVADELAARYRGGDTSDVGEVAVAVVGSGEPLLVTLRETGVSDRIPGRDIEITLEGGDQGWSIASARVRDLCVEVDESNPTQCA
jgi:hypothetical protein